MELFTFRVSDYSSDPVDPIRDEFVSEGGLRRPTRHCSWNETDGAEYASYEEAQNAAVKYIDAIMVLNPHIKNMTFSVQKFTRIFRES
jgi:hypothetical protein